MSGSTLGAKLRLGAYTLLAGSIVADLVAAKKGAQGVYPQQMLGRAGTQRFAVPQAGAVPADVATRMVGAPQHSDRSAHSQPRAKMYDVHTIDQRVKLILELGKKGAMNPLLNERTREILSAKCGGKWCVPEKDCLAEVRWLFNAIRNPRSKYAVRYTRDTLFADTFSEAERTLLKTHGGDCDDYTILLAAMLMTVGHPVKVRVIATTEAQGQWAHVYLITPASWDAQGDWLAVDCSVNKPVGWEAPGAKEFARTRRPHGIVTNLKDYEFT